MSTTSFSIVVNIIVLQVHHRGALHRRMPGWLRRLVLRRLTALLCMQNMVRSELGSSEFVAPELDSSYGCTNRRGRGSPYDESPDSATASLLVNGAAHGVADCRASGAHGSDATWLCLVLGLVSRLTAVAGSRSPCHVASAGEHQHRRRASSFTTCSPAVDRHVRLADSSGRQADAAAASKNERSMPLSCFCCGNRNSNGAYDGQSAGWATTGGAAGSGECSCGCWIGAVRRQAEATSRARLQRAEWVMFAAVLDRLFFYLFCTFTLAVTLCLLVFTPLAQADLLAQAHL